MALRMLLASLAASAHAAGMNTHTFVGHRTLTRFGKVGNHSAGAARYNAAIQAHGNAVLGGSDMPDFLYACGRYPDHHDAGEYAHWPPFQAAAVRYLRARADWNSTPKRQPQYCAQRSPRAPYTVWRRWAWASAQ